METEKVIQFHQDPLMFSAVKKYLLAVAYKHGVVEKGGTHSGTINFALNLAWGATQPNGMPRTDEELGQNLRALTYAVQLVESGFREISEIQKPEEKLETKAVNEAE